MRQWLIIGLLLGLAVVASGCASVGSSADDDMTGAAEANTKLGVELLQRGEPQRALQKLNKAVRQDPESSQAHMVRALAFDRLDKPEKAEESFEKAVSLDPENSQALNNYGSFLCQRGDVAEAIELFDRSADNPTYESPEVPLTNAGICALRNGQRDKAEDYFQQALRNEKRQPAALLRMAQIRLEREQYMSARGYYQRYLDVARQTPLSAWLGVRIENGRGEDADENALASYKQLLRNKFPDSEETEKLLEWESDGRL
jgi:type IV pilus assembly protein PilF